MKYGKVKHPREAKQKYANIMSGKRGATALVFHSVPCVSWFVLSLSLSVPVSGCLCAGSLIQTGAKPSPYSKSDVLR